MRKIIRGMLLIAILFIGIFVGFTATKKNEVTSAEVVCTFNDEKCVCDTEKCVCGEYEISSSECFDDLNQDSRQEQS